MNFKKYIIKNYLGLKFEILVCKVCKKPVEKGFMSGNTTFYSCSNCDCWTSNVEWKDDSIKS